MDFAFLQRDGNNIGLLANYAWTKIIKNMKAEVVEKKDEQKLKQISSDDEPTIAINLRSDNGGQFIGQIVGDVCAKSDGAPYYPWIQGLGKRLD